MNNTILKLMDDYLQIDGEIQFTNHNMSCTEKSIESLKARLSNLEENVRQDKLKMKEGTKKLLEIEMQLKEQLLKEDSNGN